MNEYDINSNVQETTAPVAIRPTASHLFSPKRFGRYCSKQIHEWKRGLWLQFFSLAGIYTILMVLFHSTENPSITTTGVQLLVWFGFFIYTAKSGSSLAEQIGGRSKRVLYLTVPASTAEKYIAHLLWTLILYPILFFAAIIVAQYTSEIISSTLRGESFNPGSPLQGLLSIWNGSYSLASAIVWTINNIVTFTLGATLWQKNSFLKTIAALFLLGIATIFFYTVSLDKEEFESLFTYLVVGNYFDNFKGSNILWFINCFTMVESVVLGYIGYMRMKELEINETKR